MRELSIPRSTSQLFVTLSLLGTPRHTVGQHKERTKLVSRQIQSYQLHSSSHESEYESHHLKIAPLYYLQPATQIRSVHNKVQVNQGTYHLHGKTGNSGGKFKWFTQFRLGIFRKYGL